jgi:hypothetical protein
MDKIILDYHYNILKNIHSFSKISICKFLNYYTYNLHKDNIKGCINIQNINYKNLSHLNKLLIYGWSSCGEALMLYEEFLKLFDINYVQVHFYNISLQGNHCVIEVCINNNNYFIDPTFGIFFSKDIETNIMSIDDILDLQNNIELLNKHIYQAIKIDFSEIIKLLNKPKKNYFDVNFFYTKDYNFINFKIDAYFNSEQIIYYNNQTHVNNLVLTIILDTNKYGIFDFNDWKDGDSLYLNYYNKYFNKLNYNGYLNRLIGFTSIFDYHYVNIINIIKFKNFIPKIYLLKLTGYSINNNIIQINNIGSSNSVKIYNNTPINISSGKYIIEKKILVLEDNFEILISLNDTMLDKVKTNNKSLYSSGISCNLRLYGIELIEFE